MKKEVLETLVKQIEVFGRCSVVLNKNTKGNIVNIGIHNANTNKNISNRIFNISSKKTMTNKDSYSFILENIKIYEEYKNLYLLLK